MPFQSPTKFIWGTMSLSSPNKNGEMKTSHWQRGGGSEEGREESWWHAGGQVASPRGPGRGGEEVPAPDTDAQGGRGRAGRSMRPCRHPQAGECGLVLLERQAQVEGLIVHGHQQKLLWRAEVTKTDTGRGPPPRGYHPLLPTKHIVPSPREQIITHLHHQAFPRCHCS